ncbi:MAG: hypothetical protein LBE91_04995 [Tannerella sp.]|jgi:hypothetical protein|nr:hypothetical protein [Tannerella sp.]
MRLLIFLSAFLISTFSYSQQTDYRVDKDRFTAGISGTVSPENLLSGLLSSGDEGSSESSGGGGAIFLFGGFGKTIGDPVRNGYFFSGEIRARVGLLSDGGDQYFDIGDREHFMSYNGTLAGLSVLFRPNFEIAAESYVYLEGEFGFMYEYIRTKIGMENNLVIAQNSGGYIVPQYGVKLGLRYKRFGLSIGYHYFNHTTAVNKLNPKEYKIVNSQEGVGGELGFCFFF